MKSATARAMIPRAGSQPVVLCAMALALAGVGVALLLPGRVTIGPAEVDTGRSDVRSAAAVDSAVVVDAAAALPDLGPVGAAEDRLAGPVPEAEVAAAFAQAFPAAPGLAPAQQSAITTAAATAVRGWYADAGWTDVVMQATSVTSAEVTSPPDITAAAYGSATVAVLWSGTHPVTGPSDRRLATVALELTPDTAEWAVGSIQGGPADG